MSIGPTDRALMLGGQLELLLQPFSQGTIACAKLLRRTTFLLDPRGLNFQVSWMSE